MSVRGRVGADNRGRTGRWSRLCAVALAIGAAACTAAGGEPAAPASAGSSEGAPPTAGSAPPGAVRPGIDVWLERGLDPLRGGRIGLITNTTGRTADGRLTLDALVASPDIEVAAIFTPEHALEARVEGEVADGVHRPTGLPLYSLYGDTRRPTGPMLEGLDGLVFDIQDVGTRFYTYASTMAYAMEEAATHGLPFVVLDRPNPINGRDVSGAVRDPSIEHFIAYLEVPVRHGMTIGELALWLNQERAVGADLTVVPLEGWRREHWYDDTGLPWIDPSPNIRSLKQATLYPAIGALEWTNLSVGRGTDAPFEWLGAPWIDPIEWATALRDLGLPGLGFVPRWETPSSGPWSGERCGGVALVLVDRDAFDAGRTAAALAATLARLYPDAWEYERLPIHWGDPGVLDQLAGGASGEAIVASWQERLARFRESRARHLLYD